VRPKVDLADFVLVAEQRDAAALAKDSPNPRPVAPPSGGRIVAIRQVGGLHHRYDRIAA
jgi:hypothetical protein